MNCCSVVVDFVPREFGWAVCECVKVWLEKRVELDLGRDLYPLKLTGLI